MQRIEGLSIGLQLDTIKIDSGLKDLKRKLGLVNSEMKNNMSAFDRSEKSVDKYRTRIEGLNKKLEVQRAITEKAKDRHEKMTKEFGEGSKEAENAAREYNNQSAALQNLERYVGDVTQELKEFEEQQRIASSGWTKFGDKLDSMGSKLKDIGGKMKDVGKSMSMYVTAPIVGGFAAATKASIDYESAFAGVRKTVDASEKEYAALSKGIMDMSKRLPTAATDIAEVAESAGQLGIKKENILDFTQTIIDLGESTNLSREQAATEFARFANIVQMPQDQFENLGSSVVALGNNLATTESEIVSMGMRLAGVGAQVGMSESDIMALAGAMSSVGIEAEAGGTAMSMVMKKINTAVMDGDVKLDAFAEAAGVSSKKFAKAWKDDPVKAMDMFVKGLGKSGEEGENLAEILGFLGIKGIREQDTMLRLAGAGDLLAESVEISSKAWKENTALSNEAQQRYETMASKLSMVKNNIFAFAKDIGDILTPYVIKAADAFNGFINKLSGMSKGAKVATVAIAAIAAAIGPVLVGFGTLLSIAGGAMQALAPMMGAIAKAGGLLKWLRLGFAALTGPVGITIAILSALTIGFITLYKRSETFREGVHNLLEKLKELGGKALGGLKKGLGAVVDFFKEQGKVLQDFWKENGDTIIKAAQNIGSIVGKVFSGILKVIQFAMPLVLSIIKMVWSNVKGVISGALKIIMGLVQVFSGLFTGNFSKMWSGIKNIFKGALQFIWNYVQLMMWGRLLKGILSLGKLLLNAFRNSWNAIRTNVSTIVKNIVDFVRDRFTKSKDTVSGIFTKLRDLAKTAWDAIRGRIVDPVKTAVSNVRDRFTNMRQAISDIFQKTKDKVGDYVSSMVKTVKDMPGKMAKGIKDTGYKLYESAKGVANNLVKGLGKGVNGVIGGVNWVLEKLKVKDRLDKWTVPQYAKGTGGHPHDGPAIVGDGNGRLKGRELVQTPDGQSYLSPAKPTLVNLPKGTQVFSALETKSLLGDVPKYARGTGGMVKKGLKKLKDVALNVWSYASNPGKLLDLALTTLGISKPGNDSLVGKVARGGFNMVKNNAVGYVKSMFAKAEQEGGNITKPNFGGRFRFTSGFGPRWGSFHGGVDYAAPTGTPIPSQSGGRVSYAGYGWNGGFGNLVKVRQGIYEHYYAHMSRIMAKAGQAVSRGTILGLVGNTGDSKGAHVHYEIRKNGVRLNPHAVGGFKGFATGGLVNRPGVYGLAEGGYPEYVIPTDPKRRTDAMKLLALAGRDVAGNKRPHQLPNVGANNDDQYLQKIVEKLSEQVQDTKEIVSLLAQLLIKDPTVIAVFDKRAAARQLTPEINRLQGRQIQNNEIYG